MKLDFSSVHQAPRGLAVFRIREQTRHDRPRVGRIDAEAPHSDLVRARRDRRAATRRNQSSGPPPVSRRSAATPGFTKVLPLIRGARRRKSLSSGRLL